MTPSHTDFFTDKGYVRLEGFHPHKQIAGLRQKLLDEIKRLKALSGGKSLPGALHKLPVFQQIGKLSALVKVPGVHEALVTPALIDCVTRLGGRAPTAIQDTQLLLSPPLQGTSTLTGLNWHVDVDPTARPAAGNPGLLPDRRRGTRRRRDAGVGRVASRRHAGAGCSLRAAAASEDDRRPGAKPSPAGHRPRRDVRSAPVTSS